MCPKPCRRPPFRTHHDRTPYVRALAEDERLLAGGQLYLGGADLPQGQSSTGISSDDRPHQTPTAWPLGNDTGAEFSLCSPQQIDRRARSEHDLCYRSRTCGPGLLANTYLEGSYTERYPAIERDRNGPRRLFRQCSWPSGAPSHVSPETPGAIQEGGGAAFRRRILAHAFAKGRTDRRAHTWALCSGASNAR